MKENKYYKTYCTWNFMMSKFLLILSSPSLFAIPTISLSFIVFTVLISCLIFTANILSFFLIIHSIHVIRYASLFKSLTVSSGEVIDGLDVLAQQLHTGSLNSPGGVRTWPLAKSHSEYNCFKWSLKGLFIRLYSYEVIPPGMITSSLFIAWVTDLMSSVKWFLRASSTNIPCFLNNALGLLFQTIYILTFIISFSYP